jgi:malonyl-CoA/methylmalonyl-CoA synthetase
LIDDLDGVGESAVIGLKDDDLGERVVAVVVKKDKSIISEEELIATLKQDIAGFKVPKEVIFVDELPRNAMGKVQKNVLRDNYR